MASACVAQHKRYRGHFRMKNRAHTRFWVLIATMERLKITKIKQKSLRWWRYLFSGEKSTGTKHIVWQPSEFAREKCTSPYVAPQVSSGSISVNKGHKCTLAGLSIQDAYWGTQIHAYAILSRLSMVKMQEKPRCSVLAMYWTVIFWNRIWRMLLQLSVKGCTALWHLQ